MPPPDPKPPKRTADAALLEAVHRVMRGQPCEALCGNTGTQIHHLKLRSQGGSDVRENLAWLCVHCHGAVHGAPWVDVQGIRWDADRVRRALSD